MSDNNTPNAPVTPSAIDKLVASSKFCATCKKFSKAQQAKIERICGQKPQSSLLLCHCA